MKSKSLLTLLILLIVSSIKLFAAPLYNIERILTQPDGTKLYCFASGDEFYNRLHDADGFTIVQGESGYFVYADMDRNGKIVATEHIAGRTNPKELGLQPNIMISQEEYLQRRKAKEVPEMRGDTRNLNHGVYNNLIVYIKFQGDEDLTTTKTEIDSMFNNDGYYDISMNNYFKKATYNQLSMRSYSYPEPDGDKILAYEDIYPRNYYQPYHPVTNPEGYTDQGEREFPLLKRAIEYIADQVPDTLDIDRNDDGLVDNVIFVVKGNVGDWADLLWPHMWSLYGEDAYINGKKVWTFNFQLETSSYFSTSTLCHEMSHSLGFPDLYHYVSGYDHLSPAGSWDLMCGNSHPPQHCVTYMKYKYGTWIDEIPEIGYGTYTLEANSWEGGRRNCYKIPTSHPSQYYLVEYRNKENMFERGIPGHGIIIYRVDTRYHGGANYNGVNEFDEVYIFRPGGSQNQNGTPNGAAFSKNIDKTVFNHTTDPYPFLNNNITDETFNICNISETGDQMTFTYCPIDMENVPQNMTANVINTNNIILEWDDVEAAESYNIYRDGELLTTTDEAFYNDDAVEAGYHEYYVTAVCGEEESYRSNEEPIITGDYCEYAINMTTTGENGWQGAEIVLSFDNGMDEKYFTIYSGDSSSKEFIVPVGINMTVEWVSGWDDTECAFTITQDDNIVYESGELQEGVLVELVTSGERVCVAPKNLRAISEGSAISLEWSSMVESESFVVFRDGEIIAEDITTTEYYDNDIANSGVYSYYVVSVTESCSSDPSNTAQAQAFTYVMAEGFDIEASALYDSISMSWTAPTVLGGHLAYDKGTYTEAVDCTSSRSWGIRFTPEELQHFENPTLNAVEFFDINDCQLTFKIYNGSNTDDNTLIHTEVYNATASQELVVINLSEEVTYDPTMDLWITVKPSAMTEVACSDYAGYENSCLMKVGSSWKPITEYGMEYSWILRAYTSAPSDLEENWVYSVTHNDIIVIEETSDNEAVIPMITDGEQCLEVEASYKDGMIKAYADICINAFINVAENEDNNVQIYPNPAKDILYINAEDIEYVKIISLTGVTVYEQSVEGDTFNMNIEDLPNGTYLIQINAADGVMTRPIIVNRN